MPLKFDQQEFDRMREVQAEVTRAVVPFRDNTEAGLVIFALIRTAKILLDLYNPRARADLVEVIVDHLQADARTPAKNLSALHKFFVNH